MFCLIFEKNKENFLKSWERMVQATYHDFKLDENIFNLPSGEVSTEKLTRGFFDGTLANQMVLAKNYLSTIELGDINSYPEESIEGQLCAIRDYPKELEKNPEIVYQEGMMIAYNYLFKDGKIPDEWQP